MMTVSIGLIVIFLAEHDRLERTVERGHPVARGVARDPRTANRPIVLEDASQGGVRIAALLSVADKLLLFCVAGSHRPDIPAIAMVGPINAVVPMTAIGRLMVRRAEALFGGTGVAVRQRRSRTRLLVPRRRTGG